VDISNENALVIKDVSLLSGDIKRVFIDVPTGSNFARMIVKGKQRSPALLFCVATQIINQSRYDANQSTFHLRLGSKENDDASETVQLDEYFKVVPGVPLEVSD
jgi:hypothetical protein